MTLFYGHALLDTVPGTGGVVPVVTPTGIHGLTITPAMAALIEGSGVDTISEKTSGAGVTIDGVLMQDGAVIHNVGSAAGAVAVSYGGTAAEGARIHILEETISFVANAALYKAMTTPVPAGAVILSAQANVQTALTGGSTTVKVGLGLNASDPDKYGLSSALTKNAKISTIPDWAVLAAPEAIDVCSCASNGAAGDTALTVGSVRVRVVYLAVADLVNAA